MLENIIHLITSNSPHLSWMKANILYLVKAGSHSYGTNIATSDEDFKGVACATKQYYFGSQLKFEQAELRKPDTVIFEIRKF